jgi:hypothetical protein
MVMMSCREGSLGLTYRGHLLIFHPLGLSFPHEVLDLFTEGLLALYLV